MSVLVVGLGEVGKPMRDVLGARYPCYGRDVGPVPVPGPIDVLHICYPYNGRDFEGTTVDYITEYEPTLVVIHSTVVPGTTERVARQVAAPVAYSPARGKHARMKEDLLSYTKYVASPARETAVRAAEHLQGAGMRTQIFQSTPGLELAKLLETTYFGVLLSWAQEMERYCRACEADYDEVMKLMADVSYLPPVVFRPGFIGGHCVVPNTYLLEQVRPSPFIDVLRTSNEQKRAELITAGRSLDERLSPKRVS
jgi:UDP-N-acetyl-D-mannosaminuronate dehydrogenase